MRIDCYGDEAGSPSYGKRMIRQPLETRHSGGCTYMRYGEGAKVPIHRLKIDEAGAVRETWAYGPWADADNLDYLPITETKEVDG